VSELSPTLREARRLAGKPATDTAVERALEARPHLPETVEFEVMALRAIGRLESAHFEIARALIEVREMEMTGELRDQLAAVEREARTTLDGLRDYLEDRGLRDYLEDRA
jgi:hypothetical protein